MITYNNTVWCSVFLRRLPRLVLILVACQWFGHYSYGHQGGKWNYNVVHDNVGYGFDPHDDSDHLEIIGNTVSQQYN